MAQGEWESTTALINAAIKVLEAEQPMIIRQLFYQLVSSEAIQNTRRDYQRVSKAMVKARKDGRVPYEWIVDRSRPRYTSNAWDDLGELGGVLESTLVNYRRDYWQDQPYYIEIWCEKDAVTGSIEPVREEYGGSIDVQRGYGPLTIVYDAAKRMYQQQRKGKKCVILYLGDWDPSGADIERSLDKRLLEEMGRVKVREYKEDKRNIERVEVRRIAIFKEDIVKFKLPPLRVKEQDSRSSNFKRKYGNQAVELDALPPTELRARLRHAIDDLIDREAWNRAKLVEEAQRETCKRYAAVFNEMAGAQ